MEVLNKSKILFLDDEMRVLEGLRRMLNPHRKAFDMTFVTTVEHAIKKIKNCSYDTIVSDITMPGKDGFEFLRILRDRPETRDLPVVILTGLDDKKMKKKALESGATDLLSKPVNQEELLARLQSCIRQKRYLDEIKRFNETLRLKVKERTKDLAQSRLDMILRLGYLAEFRERRMGTHGIKVGCYSRVIGEQLGLDKISLERLFVASPLHDVGKIGIPDRILNKNRILEFGEWALLREHCKFGWEILNHKIQGTNFLYCMEGHQLKTDLDPEHNPLLKLASTIALTHHEWWNGKGYPNRLKGEDIPLESRIVAFADVYDELMTEHPYQPAHSEEETLTLIREKIGEQFDPEIYGSFDKSLEKIREIKNLISRKDSEAASDEDQEEENFICRR